LARNFRRWLKPVVNIPCLTLALADDTTRSRAKTSNSEPVETIKSQITET
jgi:hypothetical protein